MNKQEVKFKRVQKIDCGKLNKKAQIETMGLLVVVILVSLILFFVLSFNINKAKSDTPDKQNFKELQAVSNFGTTMLETTDPCGRIVRELLSDCAFANQMSCQGNNSCVTASNTMNEILDLTLNQWGYEYNLSVYDAQQRIVLSTATGCDNSGDSNKETTPFSTTYGTMSVVIKTCR